MLLQPKRTKYRKLKKRYLTNQLVETKNNKLKFGCFGIKILKATRLTARQIESTRQSINRYLKRNGKLWITIFPHIPITKKPTENRMGKGKGNVEFWSVPIKAGTVIFELEGNISPVKAEIALNRGRSKMPVKSKVVFL